MALSEISIAQEFETTIQDFSVLKAEGGFHIELARGEKNTLIYRTRNFDPDNLMVKNKGGELHIYPKPGGYFNFEVNIKIHFQHLSRIEATGSTRVVCKDAIQGPSLQITKTGSSFVDLTSLDVNQLRVKSHGSGHLKLGGQADSGEFVLDGSGAIQASELNTENSSVQLNGSGNIALYSKNRLKVRINGTGQVSYSGNPEKKDFNVVNGGKITEVIVE